MEAHIIIAEAGMDETGDDMLAGMLLHPGKAFVPVEDTLHFRTDFQRFPGVMPDFSGFLMGVEDLHIVQIPGIPGLSAALREKRGLVQTHLPVILGQPLPPETPSDGCLRNINGSSCRKPPVVKNKSITKYNILSQLWTGLF